MPEQEPEKAQLSLSCSRIGLALTRLRMTPPVIAAMKASNGSATRSDPILRAKHYMQTLGIWTEAYEEQVWEEARTRINLATTDAEKAARTRLGQHV